MTDRLRRHLAQVTLLLAFALSASLAFAQQPHPAEPAAEAAGQQNTREARAEGAVAQQGEAAEKAARHDSPGAELAEASREAAGEEAEHAQFKESPSVHFLASHLGLSLKAANRASVALNFAILAVLLAWGREEEPSSHVPHAAPSRSRKGSRKRARPAKKLTAGWPTSNRGSPHWTRKLCACARPAAGSRR